MGKSDVKQRSVVVKSGGNFLVGAVVATLLWYCFDDWLAWVTGVEVLGQVAWYHAFSMALCAAALLSVSGMSWSGK